MGPIQKNNYHFAAAYESQQDLDEAELSFFMSHMTIEPVSCQHVRDNHVRVRDRLVRDVTTFLQLSRMEQKDPVVRRMAYMLAAMKGPRALCELLMQGEFDSGAIGTFSFFAQQANDLMPDSFEPFQKAVWICAHDLFLEDIATVKAVLLLQGDWLEFVQEPMKSDPEIVSYALCQLPGALKHAGVVSKNDPDLVSMTVAQDGLQLRHAGEDVRRNRDVVLIAVRQNGEALRHAPAFQDDSEVVLEAIASNPMAFESASVRLQQDADFLVQAIHKNPYVCRYVVRGTHPWTDPAVKLSAQVAGEIFKRMVW